MSTLIASLARPTTIVVWWLAIRPMTLSLSWIPVLVGSSLAWWEQGHVVWISSLAAALAAILIQVGTNLHNDAKDFERGVDNANRQGPLRVTATGWLSAAQVRKASYLAFGLAFLIGIYLVLLGGIFIMILGLLSIASGLAYTGGPHPIAYGSTGELFVFLFFGLGAVAGTYYLNVGHLSWTSIADGSALGLLAAAVLTVNNYRDMDSDRAVGKATLAINIGLQATRIEYMLLMLIPFILITPSNFNNVLLFLPWLALPYALWLSIRLFYVPPSPDCNALLARTAQLQLIFGLLLTTGYLVKF